MSGSFHTAGHPGGAVAAIGVFDGVHLGHRALIGRAHEEANRLGLPLIAVTFSPHPEAIIRPGHEPQSLATIEQRVRLLREAGADDVEILTFDESMAGETPAEFVESVLIDRLRAKVVVVGENFLFGAHAAGNVAVLAELGAIGGFEVRSVPLESDDRPWSSSRIRALIAEGSIAQANGMLGRPYSLEGVVIHGDHRGRELGYPTANLQVFDDPVIPADGVYAGYLTAEGQPMPAAISVGTNPQFKGKEQRIEAFVLDRLDLDLYAHRVLIEFTDRIRGQAVFETLEAFITQMDDDVDRARGRLSLP